jgi:hypothetical protein
MLWTVWLLSVLEFGIQNQMLTKVAKPHKVICK